VNTIGFFGIKEKIERVKQVKEYYKTIKDQFTAGCRRLSEEAIFDEVKKIENVGERQTYDLTIDTHHNFIAGNMIVHNTWWLIQVGKSGIQFRHKVLHITLELSEEKTAKRYIQSLFGLTANEAQQVKSTLFVRDPVSQAVRFDVINFERNSVYAERKDIQNKLLWMGRSELLIKEFPTGTLSTEHLMLYLDSLKRERGFVPDLIVLDYAELMKIDAQLLRIDTGRLYKELRGISGAGYALVSASQGNKESANAKVVDSTNVAEDWSKVGTADMVITYSQTIEEYRLGLARIFTPKARDAGDRFMTLISQSYPIGQFCLDSVPMNMELTEQMNAISGKA
jgi:hypothetical protein